jgi:hypothetical protein
VVPHDEDAAAVAAERGHAVMGAGRELAADERIAGPAIARVAEPFRKLEEHQAGGLILDGCQRTVSVEPQMRVGARPQPRGERFERSGERERAGQRRLLKEDAAGG